MGVDPEKDQFDTPGFAAGLPLLGSRTPCCSIAASRPEFGDMRARFAADGAIATEINNRTVKVVGLLEIGPSFGIDGTVMTSIDNWLRLFPDRPRDEIQLGLIRLRPGADAVGGATGCAPSCRRRAGADQAGLRGPRAAYWNGATPIGFVFAFGAIIGLVVGAIIVYQILFADVSEHLERVRDAAGDRLSQPLRVGHRAAAGRDPRRARLHARRGRVRLPVPVAGRRHAAAAAHDRRPRAGRLRADARRVRVSGLLALRKVRRLDPAEVFG